MVVFDVRTQDTTMTSSAVAAFAGKSRNTDVKNAVEILLRRNAVRPARPLDTMSPLAFTAWLQDPRVQNDDKPLLMFIRKRSRMSRPPKMASIIKTAVNNEQFLRLLLTHVGEKPLQEAVAAMAYHVDTD